MRLIAPVLLLATACAGPRPSESECSPLVGAWTSKVEFRSGTLATFPDLEFMLVFGEGGTLTESSNYDAAPPGPPAYGTWTRVGMNRFRARYEFFAMRPATEDEDEKASGGWMPNGRGVLTEEIELAPDARSFESTIRCDFFDPAGKPTEGGGAGVAHGTRMTAP
jgi:hypothetical protein